MLKRKISGLIRPRRGAQFVARGFSAFETCRRQRRDMWNYLHGAVIGGIDKNTPLGLLPALMPGSCLQADSPAQHASPLGPASRLVLNGGLNTYALIRLIALVLHRVMRMRLTAAGNKNSPERALELLRQLQCHRIHLSDDQAVIGLSSVSAEQAELLTSLKLSKPTAKNI